MADILTNFRHFLYNPKSLHTFAVQSHRRDMQSQIKIVLYNPLKTKTYELFNLYFLVQRYMLHIQIF